MKKVIIFLSMFCAFLFVGSISSTASEGVKLPLINGGHSYYKVNKNLLNSADSFNILIQKSSDSAVVMNLQSGNTVRYLPYWKSYVAIVNESATRYVFMDYYDDDEISYADEFNEIVELGKRGIPKGFIKGTNTFIYSYYGDLYAYNLDTNQIVFENPPGDYNEVVVGPDIAIVRDQSITILSATGEFKDVLEFDSKINNAAYTLDGTKFVISTQNEDVQIFNTSTYEKNPLNIPNTKNINGLIIDYSNHYLATTSAGRFKLYNFKTGERIHTERDNEVVEQHEIALTNEAKYMLIGSNVYSGKNLDKYIKNISIDMDYLELGYDYEPSVKITLANGQKEKVTKNVSLKTNNIDVAYIDEIGNKLMTANLGEVTLLANYLSFEVKKVVKVVDTEKPILSGVKDITVYTNKNISSLNGIRAHDIGEGDLTKKVKVKGTFKANTPGKYKLQYTVSDTSGNTTTESRTITVKYNPSLHMNHINNDFYVSNAMYTQKFVPLKNVTFMTYINDRGNNRVGYGVEIKTSKKLSLDKVTIYANGKKWTRTLSNTDYYKGMESVFYQMNKNDRKWFLNNIKTGNKVTATIKSKKKTFNKTFTNKEVQGLLDAILMDEYLK